MPVNGSATPVLAIIVFKLMRMRYASHGKRQEAAAD